MSSNTLELLFFSLIPQVFENLHPWPRKKLRDDFSKPGHAQCKWHEWWHSRIKPKIYQTLPRSLMTRLSCSLVDFKCTVVTWPEYWTTGGIKYECFQIYAHPMITATLMTRLWLEINLTTLAPSFGYSLLLFSLTNSTMSHFCVLYYCAMLCVFSPQHPPLKKPHLHRLLEQLP